nr:class I SAM-dependent methyltransferase [Actinopolymorpha cephalotaxi]
MSKRLGTVRTELTRILDARGSHPTQLVSICAGDGRDVLPVLAAGRGHVSAVLVELDGDLAGTARREAAGLGLHGIDVRTADAGALDSYLEVPRADVFLACGVFGNITHEDLETTIATLPQLLAPHASVIWTRGAERTEDPSASTGDPVDLVREVFAQQDFVEDTVIRPHDAGFRVGVHRFVGAPTTPRHGGHMFRFIR